MNTLIITGNLGADPELRFTATGQAVVNVRIADTPRKKDASGLWIDGETMWLSATAWGRDAEAVAETLRRGDRVLASGRLGARTWEKDGQQRTTVEMTIDHIGKVAKPTTDVVGDAPF